MTLNVSFNSEQVALWHVRYSLSVYPNELEKHHAYLAAGSACILCCASALEAIVNRIFQSSNSFSAWDELRISSKINTLFELKGQRVDWSQNPWQDVARLIRLRNWLAHNKVQHLGLANSNGDWVRGKPNIDPIQELKKESVERLYCAVRDGCQQLISLWDLNKYGTFDYLNNEKYEPLIR
jgi:hypothetical protein